MKPSFSRRKSGFTLIEVLLVLVILVVLASLAVVAYGPIQDRAAKNAAKVQVDLFCTALDAYQLDIGAISLDGLRPAGLAVCACRYCRSEQVERPLSDQGNSPGSLGYAVSIPVPRQPQSEYL